MSNQKPLLPPGFRFHPTDEELILHYLRNRATSIPCPVSIIAEVDIYKFDPWDLPAKATFGDREWYFFSPRDRKYPNGVRPNRAAASGYWKATGTDKPIVTSSGGRENIGVKKALVFYRGKPPKGIKTDWIMHEYRLAESPNNSNKGHHHNPPIKQRDASMRLDDSVLCRIYKKSNNQNPGTPMADREREDSNVEDMYLSSVADHTQQSSYKLPKSASLSEFLEDPDYSVLSRLLYDNPLDMAGGQEQFASFLDHPTLNQQFFQQSSESPASLTAGNGLKRQRTSEGYPEEGGVLLHPSKKYNSSTCTLTNFNNQMDTPQYNSINQPYFNHQLLSNSHLGLH